MSYVLTLQRRCTQRTNDDRLKKRLESIVNRALGSNRGKGWEYRIGRISAVSHHKNWTFTCGITFNRSGRKLTTDRLQHKWHTIVKWVAQAGQRSVFGEFPWKIVEGAEGIDLTGSGEEIESPKPEIVVGDTKNTKDYGKISLDPRDVYDQIYERKHQIAIVRSALVAAVESQFQNRFHCCLFGPPGCGKTDILLKTGEMLGKENEAYMKFDATSTTEAGASKILLDAAYIPPVLIVEEIEKTEEKSLRWLLGILDQRAEIRRTNFKIGNRARNVKMIVLATVNDIGLFRKAMSGALASRFPNQIYCPRPDRETLKKILQREVKKVNGKVDWIEPTLKYSFDKCKINDPRDLIRVCLCGRDQLLDGSFQESLEATQLPEGI